MVHNRIVLDFALYLLHGADKVPKGTVGSEAHSNRQPMEPPLRRIRVQSRNQRLRGVRRNAALPQHRSRIAGQNSHHCHRR